MAGHAPAPLPDVDTFKTNTTVSYGFGKLSKKSARNNISRIDLALQAWHDAVRTNQPLHTKRRLLASLVKECRDWISGRNGAKQTKALGKRMPQVRQLGTLAFEWLKYVQFESLKHDKKVIFPKIGRNVLGTQSLRQGYGVERQHYLSTGKQQMPVAGTFVHQSHSGYKKAVSTGYKERTAYSPGVQQLLDKSFDQLTIQDYQAIDQQEGMGMGGLVWYMKKDERRGYMLIIQNGQFFKDFLTPFEVKPNRTVVYAIDQYGSTFAADAATNDPQDRAAYLNHSTFNAGKEIICAGTFTLQFGKPTIDNASGHYQPSRDQLHAAVEMYSEAGLDLSKWNVGVYTLNGTDVFDARAFLANVNIPITQSLGKAV